MSPKTPKKIVGLSMNQKTLKRVLDVVLSITLIPIFILPIGVLIIAAAIIKTPIGRIKIGMSVIDNTTSKTLFKVFWFIDKPTIFLGVLGDICFV